MAGLAYLVGMIVVTSGIILGLGGNVLGGLSTAISGFLFLAIGSTLSRLATLQEDLTLLRQGLLSGVSLGDRLHDIQLKLGRLQPPPAEPPPSRPAPPAPPKGPWTCSRCGEHVEEQFSACWQCKEPRPTGGDTIPS